MNIQIISCSPRIDSESLRISKLIKNKYNSKDTLIDILDLSKEDIPMWTESVWSDNWSFQDRWNFISSQLNSGDAFIFVVPELSGMAPPALKNLVLLCTKELSHKPALIISVSSGMGGSYPIFELRGSSYKNTRIMWIPEHVIIRNCQTLINLEDKENEFIINRLNFCLEVLKRYSERMDGLISELENLGLDEHRYGM